MIISIRGAKAGASPPRQNHPLCVFLVYYGLAWSRRLALVAMKLTEERAECTRQDCVEKGASNQQKLESNGLYRESRVHGLLKVDERIEV